MSDFNRWVARVAVAGFLLGALTLASLTTVRANPALDVAAFVAAQSQSIDVLLASPVSSLDHRDRTSTITAASGSWTEFPATDIPARIYNKGAAGAQILTVVNRDASATFCVEYVARGTATDCGTLAASVAATCDPSGTPGADGDYVLPSQSRQFVIGGGECIFFRSSAANGDVQLSLVAR